ncbi:MAG: hypothetical protein QOE89_3873 [Pseudonocardiales bacterium]|jgi:hypothetical protein|nr:hypothetical protein [Pseudonocardiales bacterium]
MSNGNENVTSHSYSSTLPTAPDADCAKAQTARYCLQRCQAAPGRVAPIAATGPAWASELTRPTPELSLAVSVHQNASLGRPRR